MHSNKKHSFEDFIIKCCKAKEWDLRKFLKKVLTKEGFTIQEDDFLSRRCGDNSKYNKVHNLLAIRGKPRVCLVAHTDVCRDHGWSGSKSAPDVFPVLKNFGTEENPRTVIQDKDCLHQTGGDDRLGVAINTWIAINTGYDLALLFTTDEEIGIVSADKVSFPELNEFDLLVQVDRGNRSNQLVTNIGRVKLCSSKTANRLLRIAEEIGLPREEVNGMMTDVQALIHNGVAKEAVNMTCGYHNSYGDSNKEYIEVEEARDTMKFVSSIIKYYDLNLDKEEKIDLTEDDDADIVEASIIDEDSAEVLMVDYELDLVDYIKLMPEAYYQSFFDDITDRYIGKEDVGDIEVIFNENSYNDTYPIYE